MSDPQSFAPFSFDFPGGEAAPVSLPEPALEGLSKVTETASLDRIRRAIEAVGEAAYHWVIETDEIHWSSNVSEVLGCATDSVSSGRAYANLLDTDNFTSRYDTVMRAQASDDGGGVPFQIEYLFRPDGRTGRRSVWLEDNGKWFAGRGGRPAEVFGTVRRIDERHKRDQHLSFLGNCDPLTGMMNRGRMAEALGEAMSVAEREHRSCALVLAAINNLSVVNEAYGFEVADEVIVAMGRRLRQIVRTGDAIARYSGSKFGIILNSCSEDELMVAAERFLGAARESVIETERGPVWAMLSIGALILPRHAPDAETAMARAEEALTEAKRLPSDGYVVYKPSQLRASERNLNARCATEIVRCLKEDRFRLAFQPMVEAKTGMVVMHEALLRMGDEAGEMIAAAHLIPVAEKLGLVRLIDRAVVQMAIATLHNYPQAKLSLNVSGTTATDPRWFGQLIDIIAPNRDVTKRLIIEITETVALSEMAETVRFVESLRELGCSVAIDDFGAGFTSFRNLRDLPVNIIKIDGSFCRNLKQDSDNQYFVRSMIELARKFNLQTVAEWVETPEDAELLTQWNVDYLQGNLFGEANVIPPWDAAPADAAAPVSITAIEEAPALPQLEAAPEPVVAEPEPVSHPAEAAEVNVDASIDYDLSRLRAAIAALDSGFKPKHGEETAEPSYADLVAPMRQAS